MLEKMTKSPYFPKLYASVENKNGYMASIMEDLNSDLHKLSSTIKQPDFPLAKKMNWILQMLTGIQDLHSKNYIHRDLKLSNVMLTGEVSDDAASIKIIDLGGCCNVSEKSESRCSINCALTPQYSAPEQWSGPKMNKSWNNFTPERMKKYDIFSAGLIILQLFSGPDCHLESNVLAEEMCVKKYAAKCEINGKAEYYHYQNLEKLDALRYLGVDVDGGNVPVELLQKMLQTRHGNRAGIGLAINLCTRFMNEKGIPVASSVVDTSRQQAPKCLEQCQTQNCEAQCFIAQDGSSEQAVCEAGDNKDKKDKESKSSKLSEKYFLRSRSEL